MAQYETLAPQKISSILRKNGFGTLSYSYDRYSSRPDIMYTDKIGKRVSGGDFKCTKVMSNEVKVHVFSEYRKYNREVNTTYDDMAELLRAKGYEVRTNEGRCFFYVRKPVED